MAGYGTIPSAVSPRRAGPGSKSALNRQVAAMVAGLVAVALVAMAMLSQNTSGPTSLFGFRPVMKQRLALLTPALAHQILQAKEVHHVAEVCGATVCKPREGCNEEQFRACMEMPAEERAGFFKARFQHLDLESGYLADLPAEENLEIGILGNLPEDQTASNCGMGACDADGCDDDAFFQCFKQLTLEKQAAMQAGARRTRLAMMPVRMSQLNLAEGILGDLPDEGVAPEGRLADLPDEPNLMEGELAGLPEEENVMEGELANLPEEENLMEGELANLPDEPNLMEGELAGLPEEENLMEGELANLPDEPNLMEGELSTLPDEPNLMEGELSTLPDEPNLMEGELSTLPDEPNLMEGELSTLPDEPNLMEGELSTLPDEPNLMEGELSTLPDEPNLMEGELSTLPDEPNLMEGELSTLPDEPNLMEGELSTLPDEPNLMEGELSTLPDEPNLMEGELATLPDEPNLMEGELATLPEEENLIEGELGTLPEEDNLIEGELGTLPEEANIVEGELGTLAMDNTAETCGIGACDAAEGCDDSQFFECMKQLAGQPALRQRQFLTKQRTNVLRMYKSGHVQAATAALAAQECAPRACDAKKGCDNPLFKSCVHTLLKGKFAGKQKKKAEDKQVNKAAKEH
eukprot:CAMPEP_0196757552 /NCGR_PEP_ID=MMETSP1091-20130531/103721_1 /TAXON_ID=302021 /ORGANISM="Rhodomonas sp., Strain CCMP768" /LENGTH=635 /DNA_ID=CAMNT_0042106333 /DNA_START=7 /DNA_END=1914 /DNA_ORIENTATION=-